MDTSIPRVHGASPDTGPCSHPSVPLRSRIAGAVALVLALAPPAAAAPAENGKVAFAGKRGARQVIYVRNPDRTGLRVVRTAGSAREPAFSPRGRRLAFTRSGGLGAQVWVTYLDGFGLRQVTSGPLDGSPDWSPAGDAIVFARGARGRRDLYRAPADGTAPLRLTSHPTDDHSPSWSVIGLVAFVRRGRRGDDIYAIPATGGTPRRLTDRKADDQDPAWSPTGRTLLFARGKPGRRDLYSLSADGSHRRRLTALPGDEAEPAWSPDGRSLVFAYRERGRRRLYVMRVPRRKPLRRLSSRVRRLSASGTAARSPRWQPTGFDPVVAAAGDIACDPSSPHFNGGAGVVGLCRQRLTSDLLLRMDLTQILAPGDLQYEDGKLWKFEQSFDQSWGRLKELIRPVPGNHEYRDPGAAGYFDYFNGAGVRTGPAGDRASGLYSFDLGGWHVIALNSECEHIGGCHAGSGQEQWLRADLAAHPAACTLAFWHRPRFSSGHHGEAERMSPLWRALYEWNADLVLAGHEHFYERFAPQNADGGFDPARGLRQFTVGMGGRSHHGFSGAAPNSELRDNRTTGVLALTLRQGGYDWALVAVSGRITDSGSGACH